MDDISQPGHEAQRWVVALFRDERGCDYVGDWNDRNAGHHSGISRLV